MKRAIYRGERPDPDPMAPVRADRGLRGERARPSSGPAARTSFERLRDAEREIAKIEEMWEPDAKP
jgi:hypothetical protein